MAVVGAAMVAAWSVGTGVASAEEPTTDGVSSCEEVFAAVVTEDEGVDVDPCEDPTPIDECGLIPLLSTEGDVSGEGVESDDPCSVDVTVGLEGDCESPETFTFTVDATGLQANASYRIFLTSGDPETDSGFDPSNTATFDFPTDADGAVKGFQYVETEGEFDFPAGAFTLYWFGGGDFEGALPFFGSTEVGECTTETQPGENPAPVPAPGPAPSDPGTGAPVVAPVVVTHPAAAQPAVLANTGTPVTAAALLGGGLVLAGAGALLASRRRAS